jgi:uncharacterized cupin superfamily protein
LLLEIVVPPQNGSQFHTNNCEDERYYVIDSEFSIQNVEEAITARDGSYYHARRKT